MNRISTGTVIGGILQWVNKNLLAGVAGTQFDAGYENDMQEELIHAFIEQSYVGGVLQVPTEGVQNQLKLATDFFYAAKLVGLTTSHTVVKQDRGTMFYCEAGTAAVNIPSAATFDNGFLVGVTGNTDTTTINFATGLNGGGTLQGLNTFQIGVGDFVVLQAQGTAWGVISASAGLISPVSSALYSAAGGFNFTVPNGVWKARVTMTGAGAGGDNYSGGNGGGGGAGATSKFVIATVPGTVMPGSVGTAGAAGGAEGGATVFAGVTCTGGNPGVVGGGGNGGVVTGSASGLIGAQMNSPGGFGSDLGDGAAAFWGGAGKGGNPNGATAVGFGSGGGGAKAAGGGGGAGCAGAVLIEWG